MEQLPSNLIYWEAWANDESVEIEGEDTQEPEVPEEQYVLVMEDIRDGVKLPKMTMDKIVIEAVFDSSMTEYRYFVDARTGSPYYFRASGRNELQTNGFSVTGFEWDQRTTVTLTSPPFTDDICIFSRNDIYQSSKGILYRVTCWLGDQIVARYDMTLGNVEDQSGNENHATLFGGKWMRTDKA